MEFETVDKFDCHVLSFAYHEGGGGFGTVLPISPKEYREKNGTNAKVIVEIGDQSTKFIIDDDLGTTRLVDIDNSHSCEILNAIIAAHEDGLLLVEDVRPETNRT